MDHMPHTPFVTHDTSHATSHATPPILRRPDKAHPKGRFKARPIFWHEPGSDGILQSEPVHRVLYSNDGSYSDLRSVLIEIARICQERGHKHAILYLTGAQGGGHDAGHTMPPAWYRAPLADSWRITNWRTGPMAVTYQTVGVTVDVRVAASWFDAAASDYRVDQLADAYSYLANLLVTHCGGYSYLLGTPAQTGLDLLENALPHHLELEVLPDDLRELIAHNSPQGRNEVLTAPDGPNASLDTLPGLVCLDAKWMYAACLSDVPAGRYEHLYGLDARRLFNESPRTVGFYRVLAKVPPEWAHIGLLPMWDAREQRTRFPWQPYAYFESWCTGAELHLARKNGWECDVLEAIAWPDAGKHNALRNWRDDLVAARATAEKLQTSLRYETRIRGELTATAIRHILIDAIGALARRETREHHLTPSDQRATIPASAYNFHLCDEGIEWDIDRPLTPWAAKFQHPEIAAMVWGRARARLASHALDMPIASLVLLRTDALWTTDVYSPDDAYAAGSRPGEWRMKEYLPGPIPAPRDTPQALALMRQARARGKERK